MNDILILDLVNNLSNEVNFLTQKIYESIIKFQLEFQDNGYEREKVLTKTIYLLIF